MSSSTSTKATVLVTFESLGGFYKVFDDLFFTLNILGIIYEATIICFLIWKFFDKKSLLNSAFYKFLCFEYVVTILFLLAFISSDYGSSGPNFKSSVENIIKWYFQMNAGVWCSVLAVNRCTAVAFYSSHSKIWSGKNTVIIILALLFFPIFLQSAINRDIFCLMNIDLTECLPTRKINGFIFLYNNGIFAIIALIFLFFGIWKTRHIKLDLVRKIEMRLLFQTLLETVFLLIYLIVSYGNIIQSIVGADVYGRQNIHILNIILFYVQHFLPQFYLLYVSSLFRKSYLQFYYQIFQLLKKFLPCLFRNNRVESFTNA